MEIGEKLFKVNRNKRVESLEDERFIEYTCVSKSIQEDCYCYIFRDSSYGLKNSTNNTNISSSFLSIIKENLDNQRFYLKEGESERLEIFHRIDDPFPDILIDYYTNKNQAKKEIISLISNQRKDLLRSINRFKEEIKQIDKSLKLLE